MRPVELKKNIYCVGAVDYNVRDFHGFVTPRGTTYNAYLIVDKKIVLVDAVKKDFAGDLIDHCREVIDPAKIDYLIVNHVETDHSGAVPDILNEARGARIICSQKGKEGLLRHYRIEGREFQVVKSGDELQLGERVLRFITAPMIHWPDSMFTYMPQDRILLPNDAFGQHMAHPLRFADEIGEDDCIEEAAKYYANILMPLGTVIAQKIQEVVKSGIAIDIIAPSHGAIWRKNIGRIINAYLDWTAFKAKDKVVIAYDTMWGSTDMVARRLAELIAREDIEVKLYNIRKSDNSSIIRDILDAKVVLFGSPTLNSDLFWPVGALLAFLRGLKPKNKKAGIFGSYGWSKGASAAIKKEIDSMGLGLIEPFFEVQYVPNEEDLSKLEDYARVVVQAVKG